MQKDWPMNMRMGVGGLVLSMRPAIPAWTSMPEVPLTILPTLRLLRQAVWAMLRISLRARQPLTRRSRSNSSSLIHHLNRRSKLNPMKMDIAVKALFLLNAHHHHSLKI